MHIVGIVRGADGRLLVDAGQDQTRELRMSVEAAGAMLPPNPVDIAIKATDASTGQTVVDADHFLPPDRSMICHLA
ncbi:hypothetical protein [Bradyrhizobium sp.]|uniref:hypothetical protein n=1 Tax=Bradyrhizobium sp. TaxID=376 RepID=UPI003C6F1BAA